MGGFRLNNTRHLLGLGLVGGLVHVRLLELDELLELDGTLLLGVLVGILLMTPTQAVCETSASPCSRKAWRDSGCCWASCRRRHSGVVPWEKCGSGDLGIWRTGGREDWGEDLRTGRTGKEVCFVGRGLVVG